MIRVLELIESHNFNIDSDNKYEVRESLVSEGLYKPRNDTDIRSTSTVDNKVGTLKFWMLGYSGKSPDKRFHLSSTARRILNEDDLMTKRELFIKLAVSVQYPHYLNDMDEMFAIYPIRLILKLLLGDRIGKTLYSIEYARIICEVCMVDGEDY